MRDGRAVPLIMDMLPQILLSVAMGAIVYSVQFIDLRSWIILLIQVLVGVIVYFLGSKIFHIDSFDYIVSIVKGLFKKKKRRNEVES